MRLTDLRKTMEKDPQTLLATCDWQMVRPIEPISDQYYRRQKRDAQGKPIVRGGESQWEFAIFEQADPWAKCSSATRPPDRGVLCEVFVYDENGVQGESMGRMIVRTRDIGGSWGEFLTLHADAVREQGLDRKASEEAREWSDQAHARLRAIGIEWPIGKVETRDPNSSRATFSGMTNMSSSIYTSAREVYRYSEYAKRDIRPEGYVLPRWSPQLNISAGITEDVEYLFQLLEEGKKALDRKAARRAAKLNKSEA